jgi:hypothetical protein
MSNEKQIPEIDHNTPWTCTDPDNNQYGRKLSPGVYQFKEWDRNEYCSSGICDSPEFKKDNFNNSRFWKENTIVLANFNEQEIREHISAYYNSLEQLKEIYGDDWEWIVAECIFEQTSGLY